MNNVPVWVRFVPFLVLLVVNAIILYYGYVYLLAVVALVLSLVFAIATLGKRRDGDYNF